MFIPYNAVWLRFVVKCKKYDPVKFSNFVYFCITYGKLISFGIDISFLCVIRKYTKFASFTGL